MNSLRDVENRLRYIAKRNKFIKYTFGTAVAFLMMGYGAFAEEVLSRQEIESKTKKLYSNLNKVKKENEKKIDGAELELIQLMEQADQVTKSPWASWQFGLNYMYDDSNGEYKGRGDKEEKYPYEGIFKRSSNVFVRNVTSDEKKIKEIDKILKSLGEYDPGNNHSAINNNRTGRFSAYGIYGLVDREVIQENPYEIQLAATIYPKSINKKPPKVEIEEVKIEKLNPIAAPTPPSEPTPPKIYIPGFSPIAPDVIPPTLPVPPTFKVIVGADCNNGNGTSCGSNSKYIKGIIGTDGYEFLQYTWQSTYEKQGLAFKWFDAVTRGNQIYGSGASFEEDTSIIINGTTYSNYNSRTTGDTISINSYNDVSGVQPSKNTDPVDRNKQYFFVGGSRAIEADMYSGGYTVINQGRVNLNGILILGMVSQTSSSENTLINNGIITDENENNEDYVKAVSTKYNFDSNGDGTCDSLRVYGSNTEVYDVKLTEEGYVGYKIGMAIVPENASTDKTILENTGTIDFKGPNSMGMYVYLPTTLGAKDTTFDGIFKNSGTINLYGKESYGMKLSGKTGANAQYENAGTINLAKNGKDDTNLLIGMSLMKEETVKKVNLADGKAVNTGTINLQDNIENAIGMYVNIDSNMTNNGIINISAKSDGGPNSGMRADQVDAANATHSEAYNTTVINAKTINITGKNGIGMIANGKTDKGIAKALNSGTITITGGETNYGLFANDEATAENRGTITIKDSKNSIGMASLYDQANSKTSTAINNGQIVVNSANSTGVYNTGIFNMNNQAATVSVDGNQSIGIYATGDNSKTTLSAGTINVKHSGVGLYSDKTTITLDNTSSNLKLEADEGGLLFYNYESANPLNSSGKFELKGTVKAEIKDKGYAFYIKGAEVTEHGGITGVPEFLNSMFEPSASDQKLNIDLKTGGTLMILDKPTGTAMNLSTVSTLQNLNSSLGDRVDLAVTEDGSKIFSVYRGKLDIDQNVNLDEPTDDIYKLDFLSSSITNLEGQTITGTKEGQLAMFQANYDEGAGGKGKVKEIKVINEGKIVLTGNSNTSKTTTAMAGDFITLTNSGDIEVAANKTIGMFGSGGSIVENSGNILVGEEGTALFGVNKLGDSSLGDNHISLTNSGTIKVVDGHTKAFGIYANNDINTFTTLTSADSVLTNSGTIDLSNASQSMGIGAKNSTIVNSGKILLGDKGVAINSEYSNINSSGDIELGANGIAFNLDKIKATDKFNLTSKVKLNGNGSSIINITDSEFNTSSTNVIEDLKIQRKSNDDKYNYYSINNSKLVNTQAKTLTGNNIIMVNSTTSEVDWQGNVTMIGNKNIAFYATGVKTDPEIKVSNGVIKLDGESSIGMYAENSARIENSSEVSVGKKGIGIYAKSANSKVTNNGNIALLEDGTGIFLEEINGVNFSNIGKISSDSKNAKGIVFKNATSNAFENSGEINLTGPISIGVYSEGAAHTFTNKGKIAVGSTLPNVSQSVGVYAADNGIIVNEGEINAGNGSIGIFGHKIITKTGSSVTVKDGAIGIYSEGDGIDLQAGSKMKIGNDDAVAIYYNGNNGTITNSLSSLEMGKNSMGLVVSGNNNIVTNNLSTVELKGDSIYTYSTDKTGTVNGNTNIIAKTDNNYGYYTAGNLNNTGDIDFSQGIGNIGIYSITDSGTTGIAKNSGRILVGKSDIENNFYSIGMAAGYYKRDKNTGVVTEKQGHIVNTGDIIVNDSNSIGMYAAGQGSKAINQGTITVKARKGIGMFITDKAYGENALGGKIILEVGADNSVGVYVAKKSVFKNYGEIIIKANNSKGIIHSSDSTVDAGTITDNGTGNTKVHAVSNPGGNKEFGNLEFVVEPNFVGPTKVLVNGKIVTPTKIDTTSINPDAAVDSAGLDIPYNENPYFNMQNLGAASAIGMYVDTSGINFTNPIQGLQYLQGLKNVDLIIGSEAAEYTNSKVVEIGENILERYNKEILNNPQIEKWNVVSGALTWAAAPGEYDSNKGFKNIVMAKIDYREFSKDDKNLYNFLDGLEQRYDKNSLDSKEKKLFNKINNIGKNEEVLFTQAIDEMMGHPYSNVQQRVYETGRILDREFKYLRDEWDTVSKDSNKIKAFGMKGKYNTDTAGVVNYKNKAEGVAYLNENETVKLGESIGWYTGFVHNEFKFKDIGKSEEEVFEGKLGVYKSIPFDHNNGLNWTISGETFLGKNKMNRRYLVVDEIFNAKSRYWTYGAAINNELTKTHRLSEDFFFDYYGGLKLEYGRFTDIREKSGEMRLEVDGNDYFSVKPEIGTGLKYKHQLGEGEISLKTNVAYEVELGEVNKAQNKARVGYTSAGWYDLPKEKEDKNGNVKLDLNVGYSNESYGVTANIGYDTENKNTRYGVGFRVIF